MRIILFGDTPGIQQLLQHVPKENIVGIVGACIRPQYHTDLKKISEQLNISFLIQPRAHDIDYYRFKESIKKLSSDLIWCNSYSMLIRDDILSLPKNGGINIHGALLPEYRGCNPMQWAILNNETKSGVSLHVMSPEIDTGGIISRATVSLNIEDTWLDLRDRISQATDQLIKKNLPSILRGETTAKQQNEAQAVYYPRRKLEDGFFQWSEPALHIYNLIRALVSPHPGAFYSDDTGQRIVIDTYLTLTEVMKHKESILSKSWFNDQFAILINQQPEGLLSFEILERDSNSLIGQCSLKNIKKRSAAFTVVLNDQYGAPCRTSLCDLIRQFGKEELNAEDFQISFE